MPMPLRQASSPHASAIARFSPGLLPEAHGAADGVQIDGYSGSARCARRSPRPWRRGMPTVAKDESGEVERSGPARFSQLVGLSVPRRFVTEAGIDVDAFVADINEKVARRGFVLYDGQILTRSLDSSEPIDPVFEPESLDHDYEIPERREWKAEQRAYFCLDDPYQMTDEDDTFTRSSIMTCVVGPYLAPGELIAALLHGELDNSYFTCTCHYSTVVYTTRHRFVCMSCGATHVVLREPLALTPRQLLTGEEWDDFFDEKGNRHHEEVDLATVDFRDIENVEDVAVSQSHRCGTPRVCRRIRPQIGA
jgi:hypothetical protein